MDFCVVSTLVLISAFMPCLSFSSLDITLCRFSTCSISSAMESVCFLCSLEAAAALCRAAASGPPEAFSLSSACTH